MTYVCEKKCFYKSTLFYPGDKINVSKEEAKQLPKSFVEVSKAKAPKPIPKEPETLKELGEEMGEQIVKKKKKK